MRWIGRFDLFLFDLDGLLVNTEKLHFEAYQHVCEEAGYKIPWSFMEYLGVAHGSAEGLQNALGPHMKERGVAWDNLYEEKKRVYIKKLNAGSLELMPGVESLLQEVAGARIKRCVATHSSREQVEAIKHFLPALKTIPVWITREDYESPKPAPDAYFKAIELLADPGDQIIGFEDSYRGLCALQKTPATAVLICDATHPQMGQYDLQGVTHYPSIEKIPTSFKINR